jgi:hypothetical protein
MKALLGIALLAMSVTAASAQYYGGQRDNGYSGRDDSYNNNYNSSDRYDRSYEDSHPNQNYDNNYQPAPRSYDNNEYGSDRGYNGGNNYNDSYRGQNYGGQRY